MATRAIKPKRDNTMLTGWESMPEKAPSLMREDQPTVARILAMVGVMLVASGLLSQFASNYVVSPGWGSFFLSIGLVLILYHAFVDKDLQFRRVYMGLGLLLGALGVLLRILPLGGGIGGLFLPYGILALTLALPILLAVLRNETSPSLRQLLLRFVGGLGAVMILAGLLIGQFSMDFLTGEGVLFLILGLFYVGTFIGLQDVGSDVGYHAGLALGYVGAFSFLITLLRVCAPALFGEAERISSFLVPSGLILLFFSVVYVAVAFGVCSDSVLVVLVRRELAAYFYSPMAYLVLIGMTLIGWANFYLFVDMLDEVSKFATNPRQLMYEPIVGNYLVSWLPVIAQIFVVPVLTMRLLSDEKRTGTLEMVLTVPVNESVITLSKFLAAWIFYLLTWVPPFLFLVGMRALGAEPFDYRPLFSFGFAVMATGAGFIAMGVFFSSLSKNQIIAAVFTFVGMTAHLVAFFAIRSSQEGEAGAFGSLVSYMSFISLWIRSLGGVLAPRFLVFHLSAAVFFLYLTNKVLEARKWS